MRDEPIGHLALADEDGVTERDTAHLWSKQPSLETGRNQRGVIGLRQLIDNLDSNQVGTLDANCDGQLRSRVGQCLASRQHLSLLGLNPGDRKRQQSR
jgi:hypothetical protein